MSCAGNQPSISHPCTQGEYEAKWVLTRLVLFSPLHAGGIRDCQTRYRNIDLLTPARRGNTDAGALIFDIKTSSPLHAGGILFSSFDSPNFMLLTPARGEILVTVVIDSVLTLLTLARRENTLPPDSHPDGHPSHPCTQGNAICCGYRNSAVTFHPCTQGECPAS